LNSQQPKLCPQEDYLERERERDRCLGELAFILLSCRFFWKGERERDLIIIFYLKLFFNYFYLYQK
jgi:hypothetical protein